VPNTTWFATPFYLIAGLTSLHLDRRSIVRLSADDSNRLAEDFARVFGDQEFSLKPLGSGSFIMRSRVSIDALTIEPARAVVSDLQASLPTGPNAPVLRRLGAELEMWLHGHPINQRRASRGEMPVSTLWLWGGGPAPSPAHAPRAAPTASPDPGATAVHATAMHATTAHGTDARSGHHLPSDVGFGADPYFVGLWRMQGLEPLPLPDRLPNLPSYPHAQRLALMVEVTPLLHANPPWSVFEALADLDRRFIAPGLAALRAGQASSLVVIANDIKLQIKRRDSLRFWRRRLKSSNSALMPE
jgi:hypothetical protein